MNVGGVGKVMMDGCVERGGRIKTKNRGYVLSWQRAVM